MAHLSVPRLVFDTTQWSVVVAAGEQHTAAAAAALEKLCRAYWYPLYAHARRKGLSTADAEDVTQEFFRRLVARNFLKSLDRGQGSFRSFLLASMNHLLANEWHKAQTLKRGGGCQIVSFDAEEAEGRLVQEPTDNSSPERAFDRRWALTILERALLQLQKESATSDKLSHFEALKRFLTDLPAPGEYSAMASQLGLEAGTLAVAVHRLRQRYREIVMAEIAQTVTTEVDLRAEMRHLYASLD